MNSDKKMVFVIGAGAGSDINMPTGYDLKNRICDLFRTEQSPTDFKWFFKDGLIGTTLVLLSQKYLNEHMTFNTSTFLAEAVSIREGLPLSISIDNLIDSHKDNERYAICGKIAIVKVIADSESACLLKINEGNYPEINFSPIENTWYAEFYKLITTNFYIKNIRDRLKNITLIIFNYDRCVEHFLFYAFKTHYSVSDEIAAELVNCINIYHPYGSLGNLPFTSNSDILKFGETIRSPNSLLEVSQRIKTFTEEFDSPELSVMQQKIKESNKIVFLGFAYHDLNMRLLELSRHETVPGQPPIPRLNCFGTSFNIEDAEAQIIDANIKKCFNCSTVVLENTTCAEFIKTYFRRLSF